MGTLQTENYWFNNGRHQASADRLQKLLPAQGVVPSPENRKLEAFRQASNAYYDLFNNGGCNRGGDISLIFGIRKAFLEDEDGTLDLARFFDKTEPVMDRIILEAAAEQGIATTPINA